MPDLIDVNLVRDFSRNYSNLDFLRLLDENDISNFEGYTERGKQDSKEQFAFFMFQDYESKRANAFSYDWSRSKDARFYNEVRKSANLMKCDLDFFKQQGECSTIEDLKAKRAKLLRPMFRDYDDRRWQYFWAQLFLIYQINREDYNWDVNYCFADTAESWEPQIDLQKNFGDFVLRRGIFASDDWMYKE